MKVVNITEEARWGGPQVRIAKVSSELKNYGVFTTVLHPSMDSNVLVRELESLGIDKREEEIYRLTKGISGLAKFVLYFPHNIYRIVKILKKVEPDIVHCNGSWQIKGMIAAWLCRIPAVWHLNDTHAPGPLRAVFRFLAQFLADGFILASNRTKKYYLNDTKLDSLPFSIIQAPVNTNEFDPDRTRPKSDLSSLNGLKVVTVASINPIKGIDDFIEMAENVHRRFSGDVHFFVVGPIHDSQQQYGRRLQSRAKCTTCNIHFTGHSDEVPQVLKAANVYVCSSKSEASPISVWEAMAMELPVVSTDVGDVHRFVENEKARSGSVVDVGDSEALAEEVLRFLQDADLRHIAGQNSRKIACSRLDLSICAKKHDDFYRQLIS
jgi:glycosyltransferase involved in cell wall biosynthesis